MKYPKFGLKSRTLALAVSLAVSPVAALAEDELEEVVVTGSYIKRTSQADSASPLTNIDRASIDDSGILTSQELFRWLPSNTGSENQADSLTQGGTTGTANVNLRGLGLGSTLILVNGKRQTVAAQTANGGDTFVDINSLMPFIMVENIEVLKDGAAAIYGSDAVAGVVNYKTRSDFEGFEIRANYQATTENDEHSDTDLSAIFGAGNDTSHVVLSAKYFEREELPITERPDLPRKTVSGLGNPGTYILLGPSGGNAPGTRVPDPLCSSGTGSALVGATCTFDFGPSFTLAPEEKRLAIYGIGSHDVSDQLTLYTELGYTRNEALAGFSPSFPALNFPVIAGTHPNNPFGVPVVALYRPIGDGTGEPGGQRVENTVDSVTTRFVMGAEGTLGDTSWTYDVSYVFSENSADSTGNDQVTSRLAAALAGFGGLGCNVAAGVAGANGCEYFNPFGTSLTSAPNSPEILAFINSRNPTKTNVDLVTWEAVIAGDLLETETGTISLALGAQKREESRDTDRSDDAEREDLAFLFGGPDVNAEQEIEALFAELYVPVIDSDGHILDAQIAVRYEDYDTGFDSTDPKLGLLYNYGDNFAARFTYGTAFRAPTLFQLNNEVTSLNASVDTFTGGPNASAVFIGNTAAPNPNLVPEEAETYNIGVTFSPLDNLEISVDYFSVEYEDRLVQESGAAVLAAESAALIAAGCTPATLATAACQAVRNPAIVRDAVTGAVGRVFVNRFNAASAETDGFDISASYFLDTDFGTFGINNSTTIVNSFDLKSTEGGPTIDGAGQRNETNPLANPIPELRSNTSLSWNQENMSANVIIRYIDEYKESNGSTIDNWTVVDVQYSHDFEFAGNAANATVGILNIFDEEPPEVAGNLNEFGYDTKTHDARGAVWYARFKYIIE